MAFVPKMATARKRPMIVPTTHDTTEGITNVLLRQALKGRVRSFRHATLESEQYDICLEQLATKGTVKISGSDGEHHFAFKLALLIETPDLQKYLYLCMLMVSFAFIRLRKQAVRLCFRCGETEQIGVLLFRISNVFLVKAAYKDQRFNSGGIDLDEREFDFVVECFSSGNEPPHWVLYRCERGYDALKESV